MSMKIVGGEEHLLSYWDRFDRLQRTAHKLGAMQGSPRGVFRFSSFAAFEEWKRRPRIRPVPPAAKTSSPSAAS